MERNPTSSLHVARHGVEKDLGSMQSGRPDCGGVVPVVVVKWGRPRWWWAGVEHGQKVVLFFLCCARVPGRGWAWWSLLPARREAGKQGVTQWCTCARLCDTRSWVRSRLMEGDMLRKKKGSLGRGRMREERKKAVALTKGQESRASRHALGKALPCCGCCRVRRWQHGQQRGKVRPRDHETRKAQPQCRPSLHRNKDILHSRRG